MGEAVVLCDVLTNRLVRNNAFFNINIIFNFSNLCVRIEAFCQLQVPFILKVRACLISNCMKSVIYTHAQCTFTVTGSILTVRAGTARATFPELTDTLAPASSFTPGMAATSVRQEGDSVPHLLNVVW